MKKLFCSVSAFLMVLLLVGCGTGVTTINSSESTTDHSASMRYDSFDGTMEYKLSVGETDLPATVSVEITTESGALALSIEKADGTDTPYTGQELPTTGFDVTLAESGDYVIRVTGDHHSGSYSFDWGK